jgi:predicted esterase
MYGVIELSRQRVAMPTRVFIHGLESSSKAAKGAFFREKYPNMIIDDYAGPFEQRMAALQAALADKDDLILVGSSYGGLMATVFALSRQEKLRKLVLLAPALNHMPPELYRERTLDFPVILYQGNQDEVVPPAPVYEIARTLFTDLAYHLVHDDHSLHETFFTMDWDELLAEPR